jgi:hypothetical protein
VPPLGEGGGKVREVLADEEPNKSSAGRGAEPSSAKALALPTDETGIPKNAKSALMTE